MNNIAIFASGSGTNAENIIRFFRTDQNTNVRILLSNKPSAGAILRAKKLNVPTFIFDRNALYDTDIVLKELEKHQVNFIVLAGFLWLIPLKLIRKFPNSIVNIHPALLPKYGGKGMYGSRVHEAVIQNGESESGITIHYVNEKYDEGNIIYQARCKIDPDDTPETLAKKVHELEYEHYPKVIDDLLQKT